MALDAERRQAIETRLDHYAARTEPALNPALVDELTTQVTEAPHDFARRDLVPEIAYLPLPQWLRFRDWQAGLRRNDPATQAEVYVIKRGLQLLARMLPANDSATNDRAGFVDEIDTWHRINGKSPDDAAIAEMLERHVSGDACRSRTLEWDPGGRPALVPLHFAFPPPDQDDRPGIHRVQDANRTVAPSAATLAQIRALSVLTQRAVIAAQRALVAAEARVAAARAAAQAVPAADVAAASAAARALRDAMQALEATARAQAEAVGLDEYVREQMRAWSYPYAGQRFKRILEKNELAEAAALGFEPTNDAPIDAQGRRIFVNPRTGEYIVRAEDVRTPGVWEHFDARGGRLGFVGRDLQDVYLDPPLDPNFPPHAVAMTPEQKEYKRRLRGWEQLRDAMLRGWGDRRSNSTSAGGP
ncbi:MAG: hypothetical protein AB7O88_22140 [Reyranellaceae bacterium]